MSLVTKPRNYEDPILPKGRRTIAELTAAVLELEALLKQLDARLQVAERELRHVASRKK